MKALERIVAEKLLKIKAVKLQPGNPFTWASGWKSPIYCDNRKTLSYPALRTFLKIELARTIVENFGEVEAVAGVATGAIAQGALVADLLGLPFVYIVVVEDLISTGGSSLKAVEAVRNFGCTVIGMVAIYTHGFPVAEEQFQAANVRLITLSNYDAVIEEALKTEYITPTEEAILQEWRKDPAHWNPQD